MRTVPAYALKEKDGGFQRTEIERRDVGQNDVLIKIEFAGICHSDIHTAREEWGSINYPLVPGHEIAGIVEEVGAGVTRHKVGDRVGVGCMVNSCKSCENCLAGEEQYCLKGNVGTYDSTDVDGTITKGGYSTHVVVDEDFVVTIPEGIELDEAAPLLCAGITMFSPLSHWGAGPGKRVAIVGLGGLGHVGVKIAAAMGAEVDILTRSDAKRLDAERLGATGFHATGDPEVLKSIRNSYDLIVNTVSAGIDANRYLGLLRRNGVLVNVGVSPEGYRVTFPALATNRRSLAASGIGGIAETQAMLDFCAAHGIGADIEVIDASKIDEAYDRVVASDVRYRFVIDTATI